VAKKPDVITREYTPGRGKSSSKPSFSGSMLIFGIVFPLKHLFQKTSFHAKRISLESFAGFLFGNA